MRLPFSIAEQKDFDAIGFGLNAVDHLLVVPEYPAFDTKIRFAEYERSAGGQTASTMVALQRLGLNTAYAGRFGSDDDGQFGRREIEKEQVNLDFAEMIEGANNQVAFIIIDARSGERTIIWDRDDRLAYRPEEVPVELAGRGRVLHLDAHDPPACVVMAKAAREAGAIVTADIDNVYEGVEGLLPLIDVLITSAEFPHRLLGIKEHHEGILELKTRFGCPIVGVTLGSDGAVIYYEGEFITSKAFAVPGGCRDTTGAGDAFHAGFIYGMLCGDELENCLKLGNAVAALKCRRLGARAALPTINELADFVDQGM